MRLRTLLSPARIEAYLSLTVEIPSASGPGSHLVSRRGDGTWYCPCRGFSYHRGQCSHLPQARVKAAALDAAILSDMLRGDLTWVTD
jgi:hypothetical protein